MGSKLTVPGKQRRNERKKIGQGESYNVLSCMQGIDAGREDALRKLSTD